MSDFFEMRDALESKNKAPKRKRKGFIIKTLAVVVALSVGAVTGAYKAIQEAEEPVGYVSMDFCKIKKCGSYDLVY